MADYSAAIIEAVTEILEEGPPAPMSAETKFENDLGFDSGHFIELFLILEETIPGFRLGAARLAPEDFKSIANLSDFIDRRLHQPEPTA